MLRGWVERVFTGLKLNYGYGLIRALYSLKAQRSKARVMIETVC